MTTSSSATIQRRRYRLLYRVEARAEPLMFVLAFVWLGLMVLELIHGLTEIQELLVNIIWGMFIVEFLIKLLLAPRRLRYLRQNWLLLAALLVPALRIFRMFSALRLLRFTRVTSTTRIVRAFTPSRQAYAKLKQAQGVSPAPEMNVGIMIANSRESDATSLQSFAQSVSDDIRSELENATTLEWIFHLTEPLLLDSNAPQRPADFLDEASLRMVEGPYDLIIVVTDVALVSRKRQMVTGLASPTSHVITVSTRRLTMTPRAEAQRSLTSQEVRLNAGSLLLALIGRLCGLKFSGADKSQVMRPFRFNHGRTQLPRFNEAEQRRLARLAYKIPERELHNSHPVIDFIFHIIMALRHPGQLLRPLWRSRAPLLPLALPGLTTAAVAPSFLLVFTAEIWDVGLGMSNFTAAFYAIISILAATVYLIKAQSLFLPRESNKILTEHLAITNTVIFSSILLACIGLFFMVGALMLFIALYIFPAGLMETWPTLEQPSITHGDTIRLCVFIATVGVTTGALAGGFESRTVIRHLALFEEHA